jgi:hypothetical protein
VRVLGILLDAAEMQKIGGCEDKRAQAALLVIVLGILLDAVRCRK